MPRIRTLKPEIWASPQVMDLEILPRLLFIGLITQADDEGRGLADLRKLKAAIFPGDEMPLEHISIALKSLSTAGLIHEYSVNLHGNLFQVRNWTKHQRINRPTSSSYPAFTNGSESTHGALTEDSRGIGSDRIGTERIGSDQERAREPGFLEPGSAAQTRGEDSQAARKLALERLRHALPNLKVDRG